MKALIIYNTTTGNTKAIAYKMKQILEKYNHDCEIYRDKEIQRSIKNKPEFFNEYNLLLLGSCTHGFQPAIMFNSFIKIIKTYDFRNKSLICFSSSGFPNVWKVTCNKIKENFPDMNYLGSFGCSLKSYDTTIKKFEEIIKTL